MAQPMRSTREFMTRIDKLQEDLVRRFQKLLELSAVNRKDRSVTAVTEYQIKTETSALIKTAEDVQTLIRQLQEMWLFGQLNTLGESKVQQQTDENAKVVADLLKQLTEKQVAGEQAASAAG
ncbi:hypothetical protein M409DRAFT_26415 [Zasmidium cellare ATCC 36951]|uniref:Mediator of RNA polymerase II transcription subunit 22 n=1 Tax=Zasmidium cellare ATCC 36951 TaxID=1080233 RepID=A0A6A6CCG8_ZASCE|nr:uncharacterized protein M409DRAFT_26415 [Zasmidium cellare ATCC 36951]KAF2163379.1 hypothetical protein M409DRAFT_26415 [Zasmidium cellare ATCC 36951]